MLKNEYLIAKFGLDTAENGPQKGQDPITTESLRSRGELWRVWSARFPTGPFSAVSKPDLAIKYSFFSIFQNLEYKLTEFSKLKFCQILSNFL